MREVKQRYEYRYPFHLLVQAYQHRFDKFPNPLFPSLLKFELFDKHYDAEKRIVGWTTRGWVEPPIPDWLKKIAGHRTVTFVVRSTVDYAAKRMVSYISNEQLVNRLKVDEISIYHVHEENPDWCVFEQTSRLSVNIPFFAAKAEDIIISAYTRHYATAREVDEKVVRELLSLNPEKFERSRALTDPRATAPTTTTRREDGGEDSAAAAASSGDIVADKSSSAAAAAGLSRHDSEPDALPSFSVPAATTRTPLAATSSASASCLSPGGGGTGDERKRTDNEDATATTTSADVGGRPTSTSTSTSSSGGGGGRSRLSKSKNSDGSNRQLVVAAERAFASYAHKHVSHPELCATEEMKSIFENPDMPSYMHGHVVRVIFDEHGVEFEEQHYIRFGVFPPEDTASSSSPATIGNETLATSTSSPKPASGDGAGDDADAAGDETKKRSSTPPTSAPNDADADASLYEVPSTSSDCSASLSGGAVDVGSKEPTTTSST